jgi:hypothetical protein
LFLQIVDIFKNKRNRKQQNYDVYLTKLITHDEISPFDGNHLFSSNIIFLSGGFLTAAECVAFFADLYRR